VPPSKVTEGGPLDQAVMLLGVRREEKFGRVAEMLLAGVERFVQSLCFGLAGEARGSCGLEGCKAGRRQVKA
jgi:hypothetical protein